MKTLTALASTLAFALTLAATTQGAQAQEYQHSGPRVEARLGWEFIYAKTGGSMKRFEDSISIGAEVGYDLPVGEKVTVGPYANYEYARSKRTLVAGVTGSDGTYQLGARLGVRLDAGNQIYLKGGYQHLRWKAELTGGPTITVNTDGWVAALGVDHNLSERAYFGVEASYGDLGQITGTEVSRPQVALKLGMRF